ncbi:MAG: hypothetical protein U9P14_11655, partial [Gemmatimonadota bacterium]|nr:hypothetical protein [Gemmatimonadota bacterium]
MRKYLVCAFLLFACVAFPEYSPAAKISAEDWIAAPTDSMAGRYGAFMEGYRYRKLGHLSLISDGVDVYSITFGENIFLGRPDIYSAYNYKEKFGWNGVERTYEFTDKGTRLTINESGFAPGFLYETDDSVFRWCWLEQLTGQGYILPLESGNSFRTEGERYIKALHGDLKNNWMLVSFSGSRQKHDCPLLFIFENHPSKIEVVTHEFVDIRFEGSAGKIVVMPLYGVKKIEHEKSAQWKESFPAQIAAECDAWARRMEHYPVVCREEYAFNEKDNSLAIRNVFEFISFKNSESKPLAPISPMLSVADQTGYPVKIQGQVLKAEYPTNYGPMNYAEGPSVTYTVPSCSYVDRVLAPVRVKGVRNIDQVEKALEKYISNPNYLWPGDHDYFPDDVMDTMHNLRLLSWASWSLSPSKRKKAIKQLAEPGLERIGDENNRYFFFRDPVAGRDYARDSTIFAQRGKTSYDSDWYNGFQVAGLWAYTYFGNREHGLSLARRHWKEFSALYRYMEIYHDWAMSCAVTDPRGNLTDYDCMRNGWNGVIAYARLAKELRKEKEYLT